MNKRYVLAICALITIVSCMIVVLTSERPQCPNYKSDNYQPPQMARGQILAADKTVLAEDEPFWDIHLDPLANGDRTNVWTDSRAASLIADKLALDFNEVKSKFDSKGNRYVPIKMTRDAKEIATLKKYGLGLRLCIEKRIGRRNPLGRAACHVTGFCMPSERSSDLPVGESEIELAADEMLQNGLCLETDIIPELQLGLYKLLSNAITHTECKSANAIILEHRFEHILALVNYPDFDPNEHKVAAQDQLLNRCLKSLEHPGAMLRPLLNNPCITNDSRLVYNRLKHLGFGTRPNIHYWNDVAVGRIPEPEHWTERYHDTVLKGGGFFTTTYHIAIAYARSAKESNPIPRAMSSCFYYDRDTGSFTNTVNIIEATANDKTLVLCLKNPASNFACRKYLSELDVNALIAK